MLLVVPVSRPPRLSAIKLPTSCADAVLLVATTIAPAGITCEYVSGVPFLTGMGKADAEKKIVEIVSA